MDIRKYFQFGGIKSTKTKTESPTNSKELNNNNLPLKATPKRNNDKKISPKEDSRNKDGSDSNKIQPEKSPDLKPPKAVSEGEDRQKAERKSKEKNQKNKSTDKNEVQNKNREILKKKDDDDDDVTSGKKCQKISSSKVSPKEDKKKDKTKDSLGKSDRKESDKNNSRKAKVVQSSDTDQSPPSAERPTSKPKRRKIRVIFEDSDEEENMKITNCDSDDDDNGDKKRNSGFGKTSDKGKSKVASHKRKRLKTDESDEEDFQSEVIHKTKSSSKQKKNKKKQISSDEDEEDPFGETKKQKKKSKKKSVQVSDSDSEKEVKHKPKRQKSRSAILDSDEDNKVSKSGIENFFKPKSIHEEASSSTASKPSKISENVKSVKAADFFGSSTVKRTERNMGSPIKRKISKSCEDEFHDDDDFSATLELLDMEKESQVKKIKVESPKKEKTPTKNEASPSIETTEPGLAGKLATKMKMEKKETLKNSSPPKEHSTPKSTPSQVESPARTAATSAKKIDIPETPEQKQPHSAEHGSAYRAYLNREGPKALGSKEIPQGAENCLEGLTFVITGILESIERDDAKSLIERYGGKVTGSVSGRTSYVVIGRDAGESKLKKAISLKKKQISEDELFDLIRNNPGKKSKYAIEAEKAIKNEINSKKEEEKNQSKSKMASPPKISENSPSKASTSSLQKISPVKSSPSTSSHSARDKSSPAQMKDSKSEEFLLWVDKYKPKSLKQVIGQNGEKSNAKKLLNWLQNWQSNREANVKPSSNRFFGANDTGAGMKAALLSGPPGVGKTTTAHLVCQEIGFSVVEMNASDTRSKTCLQSDVMALLQNSSLVDFCGSNKPTNGKIKHCLIMDEVDGMAGNEDRGGIAELIHLIKTSKIPIICLCNDRQHPKIRSLVNHCFDLRFQRPRVEQIKAAMMTLAFKEGLKIPPPALNEIIVAANQDIRQIIHNLSMMTSTTKHLSYDDAKSSAQNAKKDTKMGPFDVCRQVFVSSEETRKMSINDKIDLFFHNYQLCPLFVQENYPSVHPNAGRKSMSHHLSLLAHTANSICDGDLVEKLIRQQQLWGLLPTEAMYASVFPGEYMRGNVSHMVSFPKWLGKFSSRNKNDRILQELGSHMRLRISSDKRGFNLDYLPCLRQHLTKPLQDHDKDGVPQVIQLMDEYDIIKEDYDNIMDFTSWPNTIDYTKSLSSSTKAAFTRAYNKESHMTPYSTVMLSKKRAKTVPISGDFMEGESAAASDDDDDGDDDDISADSMIKKKKPVNQKTKKPEKSNKKQKSGKKS